MVRIENPYRDKQQDWPTFYCAACGQAQYAYDRGGGVGGQICACCLKRGQTREANYLTMLEMSAEYRAQAEVLRNRIHALEQAAGSASDREERERLQGRIQILTIIWRETRDLAVLLERYYERGYRRNGHYAL